MLSDATPLPQRLPPTQKLCDYEAIRRFAVLSDDFNPIHVDRAFAAASPMGGIIAHGPMSLGLVFQSLTTALGSRGPEAIAVDVYFRRPVRENDTITVAGELCAERMRTYSVWVKNQNGEIVAQGVARIGSDEEQHPTPRPASAR